MKVLALLLVLLLVLLLPDRHQALPVGDSLHGRCLAPVRIVRSPSVASEPKTVRMVQ